MAEFKYKAFISYSHRDEKWARWLHKSLEGYKIHKHLIGKHTDVGEVPDKLAPVFRDRDELASATDLGAVLSRSLELSWCQIVICSTASAQSHWVNEEILAFKRLGRANRIFSLIVDGEPYATNSKYPEQECFPPALRFQLDAHGELSNVPAEPIAADAREGKDGKAHALLKIIAGILGLGFDDLKQRELHRRHRRMLAITGFATTGMLFAIGLATMALIARNEAEVQRLRAQTEAETAQRTANFMISLFSVSDPSEARGNTITAREILDKGAQRIEQELTEQPDIQANLMNTIAKVYTTLGLFKQAQPLMEKALQQRQSLLDSKRVSELDMVDSLDGMANIYTQTADYQQAESLYKQAISLLTQLDQQDSAEMADVHAGLAELYFRMGRYSDAEPLLLEVLQERSKLFGEQSLEVAQAIQQLGMNLFDLGRYDEAEVRLRDSLKRLLKLFGNEPHPALAENIINLASLLYTTGNYSETESLYRQALAMNRKLVGDSHPDVAAAYSNLAFLYHDLGEYEKAENMYRDSLRILRQVYGEQHPQVARAINNLAFLQHDQGKSVEAQQLIDQAVDMAIATLGEKHDDVARYMSTRGRWLAERGQYAQAAEIHRRSLAIKIELLGDDHTDVAVSRFDLADALLGLNQAEEALQLSASSVASLKQALGNEHWYAAVAQLIYAKALIQLKRYPQAEAELLACYQIMTSNDSVRPLYITKVLQQLVLFYQQQGQTAKANIYEQLLQQSD